MSIKQFTRKQAEYLESGISHPLHHADVVVHEEIVCRLLGSEDLEQNHAKAVHVALLGDFSSLHVLCSKGHRLSVENNQDKAILNQKGRNHPIS